MEKFYRFAGVEISVQIPDSLMYDDERALAPFRVEHAADPHRYYFSMVEELTAPSGREIASFANFCVYDGEEGPVRYIGAVQNGWKKAYIRVAHRGKDHDVQLIAREVPNQIRAKMVLNALGAEHLVLEKGGFILHASCIEYEGRAVLFTAPSGTGKSTQAELWKRYRDAEIINGDRIAVRMVDGRAVVSGIPFAGSSPYCLNRTLPLAAVVTLQQAPETTIESLSGFASFRKIWEGISLNTWDERDINLAADILQQILEQVPVCHLACRKDESAVIALEKMLGK